MPTGPSSTFWQEVGDRCYRHRYQRFDLNIGVIRGDDGLLVIDTRGDHREAYELLADLRALQPGPVRWVTNTHWHFDHLFGNAPFVTRATHHAGVDDGRLAVVDRDLELWAHEQVPRVLERERPSLISELQAWMPAFADALAEVVLTPPDHLVDERVDLDLGDRVVQLRHGGRGHTDNDLVLVVPDAGVVFAGDLVEESAPPALGDDSFPLDWHATLTTVLGCTDAATFVPGHGDVVDRAFVAAQRDDLRAVAALFRALHAADVPEADALAAGGERWALPADALGAAVGLAYAQLDRG
jgi:glyoxylase-like metal-dependent hydrolase (beta-lactamase superfamily II)